MPSSLYTPLVLYTAIICKNTKSDISACLCKCLNSGCAKTIFLAFTLHLLWVHRKLYRSIFYIICKIQPFQSLRGLVVSAVVSIVIAYADLPNQYQFSKQNKQHRFLKESQSNKCVSYARYNIIMRIAEWKHCKAHVISFLSLSFNRAIFRGQKIAEAPGCRIFGGSP